MPFQPFGYRFDIASPMHASKVKAAIRAQKKGWFEAKDGPRGWIIGPFLCLWNSVFDRSGPMVLARITSDGHATRIRGRAGSDLNGLLALTLLTPVMAFLFYEVIQGQPLSTHLALLIVFFGVGIPLTFWMANCDKRKADPLVRFLQRTVGARTAKSVAQAAPYNVETPIARVLDENGNQLPATAEGVRAAIEGLGVGAFVIVERESEQYMQVLSRTDDYLLEKREGRADRHFQVCLPKGEPNDTGQYDESEREIILIMTDYLFGVGEARTVNWKRKLV